MLGFRVEGFLSLPRVGDPNQHVDTVGNHKAHRAEGRRKHRLGAGALFRQLRDDCSRAPLTRAASTKTASCLVFFSGARAALLGEVSPEYVLPNAVRGILGQRLS